MSDAANSQVTIGRFAPSPSGPLHFGSLVAAVASYCQARSQSGKWLLRIEDVDTPRVVKGAADQIIRDLEAFGFEWDGPVLFQSKQFDRYQQFLQQLLDQGNAYACECSRRHLREQQVASGPLGQIYPGNCRDKNLDPAHHSIRLNTNNAGTISFDDRVYGRVGLDMDTEVGDFVLKRVDKIYAYHLAVVVDDHLQGINEIVRGADLIENTCLHILLQQQLGMSQPGYMHVPLVNNTDGVKLSKQTGASPINSEKPPQQLYAALQHLGQQPIPDLLDASPMEILSWATDHWNIALVPRTPTTQPEELN